MNHGILPILEPSKGFPGVMDAGSDDYFVCPICWSFSFGKG